MPPTPLALLALLFGVFALVLLGVPPLLVARRARPWKDVMGLWIAGWGFLLIGAGVALAPRGLGSLAVLGVMVTTAGHLLQSRATRR